VAEDRKGILEIALLISTAEFSLIGAALGTTIMPVVWAVAGFPAQADYPLHPVPCVLGLLTLWAGLWLFHRSHADLGTNWSVTLQMRDNHSLVSTGIYRRIRHPMYAPIFLLSIAHVLFVSN
jgi:protein-S-isoprenylcysteine O-methyltransferase Ste14